ncbi:uncharacterized protein LOC135835253 isoform X1 [Planococcus citri]|uniref:uncharacterized protein LOC135835253 isoform X1 n=1 Tax=Planococcus citri TaxID=170843 RepID=UPI0031FA03A4
MVGKAVESMKDVGTEGKLYKPTLQGLYKSFFNRRRIIAEHFVNIVDLPAIKNTNIRESVEKLKRCLRGLNAAGLDTNSISPMVTFLTARKLPDKLRMDWDTSNHDYSVYPSFESLASFLINRSFAYETANLGEPKEKTNSSPPGKQNKSSEKSNQGDKKSLAAVKQPCNIKCIVCGDPHFLNQCKVFGGKTVNERFSIVKGNRLCLKCFNPFHGISACKRPNCSKCQGAHNVLLHREYVAPSSLNSSAENNSNSSSQQSTTSTNDQTGTTSTTMCATSSARKCVLLSTAVVKVICGNKIELARVLFDQGSEISLVSREFCVRTKLLGLGFICAKKSIICALNMR